MALESERRFLLKETTYAELLPEYDPQTGLQPLALYQKYLSSIFTLQVEVDEHQGLLSQIRFPDSALPDLVISIPNDKQRDFFSLTKQDFYRAETHRLDIGGKTQLRIRSSQGMGEIVYHFTIKIKKFSSHAKDEFETDIPGAIFDLLREKIEGESIAKKRLCIGPMEIDRLERNGKGLDLTSLPLIVEIEDDRLQQHADFIPPAWLRSAKEITNFKGISNNSLAKMHDQQQLAALNERLQRWQPNELAAG